MRRRCQHEFPPLSFFPLFPLSIKLPVDRWAFILCYFLSPRPLLSSVPRAIKKRRSPAYLARSLFFLFRERTRRKITVFFPLPFRGSWPVRRLNFETPLLPADLFFFLPRARTRENVRPFFLRWVGPWGGGKRKWVLGTSAAASSPVSFPARLFSRRRRTSATHNLSLLSAHEKSDESVRTVLLSPPPFLGSCGSSY